MSAEDFGRVGLLLGGESSEREISIKSGRAVAAALRNRGVEVVEIGEKGDIVAGVLSAGIDRAFIALHGRFGEDGRIQAFLATRRIPYTGSGVEASRLAMDKAASRRRFESAGLRVPPWREYGPEEPIPEPPWPWPVVVKPCCEGSSIGLSVVSSPGDFKKACRLARRHDERIILEEFISGTELTVAILEDSALPVVEIVPGSMYFDFEAKYVKGKSRFIVPARIGEEATRKVQAAALAAHRALGCRAYSRVDVILGHDGIPYILEINTIPGFTENSLYPMAARAAGIDFEGLCLKLLRVAAL